MQLKTNGNNRLHPLDILERIEKYTRLYRYLNLCQHGKPLILQRTLSYMRDKKFKYVERKSLEDIVSILHSKQSNVMIDSILSYRDADDSISLEFDAIHLITNPESINCCHHPQLPKEMKIEISLVQLGPQMDEETIPMPPLNGHYHSPRHRQTTRREIALGTVVVPMVYEYYNYRQQHVNQIEPTGRDHLYQHHVNQSEPYGYDRRQHVNQIQPAFGQKSVITSATTFKAAGLTSGEIAGGTASASSITVLTRDLTAAMGRAGECACPPRRPVPFLCHCKTGRRDGSLALKLVGTPLPSHELSSTGTVCACPKKWHHLAYSQNDGVVGGNVTSESHYESRDRYDNPIGHVFTSPLVATPNFRDAVSFIHKLEAHVKCSSNANGSAITTTNGHHMARIIPDTGIPGYDFLSRVTRRSLDFFAKKRSSPPGSTKSCHGSIPNGHYTNGPSDLTNGHCDDYGDRYPDRAVESTDVSRDPHCPTPVPQYASVVGLASLPLSSQMSRDRDAWVVGVEGVLKSRDPPATGVYGVNAFPDTVEECVTVRFRFLYRENNGVVSNEVMTAGYGGNFKCEREFLDTLSTRISQRTSSSSPKKHQPRPITHPGDDLADLNYDIIKVPHTWPAPDHGANSSPKNGFKNCHLPSLHPNDCHTPLPGFPRVGRNSIRDVWIKPEEKVDTKRSSPPLAAFKRELSENSSDRDSSSSESGVPLRVLRARMRSKRSHLNVTLLHPTKSAMLRKSRSTVSPAEEYKYSSTNYTLSNISPPPPSFSDLLSTYPLPNDATKIFSTKACRQRVRSKRAVAPKGLLNSPDHVIGEEGVEVEPADRGSKATDSKTTKFLKLSWLLMEQELCRSGKATPRTIQLKFVLGPGEHVPVMGSEPNEILDHRTGSNTEPPPSVRPDSENGFGSCMAAVATVLPPRAAVKLEGSHVAAERPYDHLITDTRHHKCPWCFVRCPHVYALLKHLRHFHFRFSFTLDITENSFVIYVVPSQDYEPTFKEEITNFVMMRCHGSPKLSERTKLSGTKRRLPYTEIYAVSKSDFLTRQRNLLEFVHPSILVDEVVPPQEPSHPPTDTKSGDKRNGPLTNNTPKSFLKYLSNCYRKSLTGHNRIYYRSNTYMPLFPREVDYDSESEAYPTWLIEKRCGLIDDFTDVDDYEKEFMKLWNRFMMQGNTYLGECHVYLACKNFLAYSKRELITKSLTKNFIFHLCQLYHFELINGTQHAELWKIFCQP